MSFIEEVEAFKSVNNQTCKVRLFLDNQDEKALTRSGKDLITDEVLFAAAKSNTMRAVHKALVDRGFKFSDEVVNKHLRGTCRCALEAAQS